MKGTPASSATGTAASAGGVPAYWNKASTFSCSMSVRVFSAAFFGS
jgi:hypothetical protein